MAAVPGCFRRRVRSSGGRRVLLLTAGAALLASLCVAALAAAGTPARAATANVSGAPYAWGDNSVGELGDGTTTQHDSPEPVTLATGVTATAVSAGTTFSLAIGSDDNLYAWGDNTFGELGDGTTTQHNSPEVITLASGVKPTAISAGELDGMAIGSDGNLYDWGSNTATINGTLATFGELGDGTTTTHDSPEVITLATGVVPVAVSAGLFDTLAIGAACSGTATTAPTCPGTPTTTSDASPTSSDTTGSNSTPTPSDTTRSGATATAGTSAAPSTRAAVAPTNTPAGAAVAVQAAAPLPVGAPATGGGTGTEFSGTVDSGLSRRRSHGRRHRARRPSPPAQAPQAPSVTCTPPGEAPRRITGGTGRGGSTGNLPVCAESPAAAGARGVAGPTRAWWCRRRPSLAGRPGRRGGISRAPSSRRRT